MTPGALRYALGVAALLARAPALSPRPRTLRNSLAPLNSWFRRGGGGGDGDGDGDGNGDGDGDAPTPGALPEGVIEVSLARPLGLTAQEVSGGAVIVRTSRGGAKDAGVRVGDEIVGISAVFGDGVWDVAGAGLDRVEGLIRSRAEDVVTVRLRRGPGAAAAASGGEEAEEDVDTATFRAIFDAYDAAGGGEADDDADEGANEGVAARVAALLREPAPE